MTLNELKPGQSAIVSRVGGSGALRQHFLDMGLIPGVEVTLVKLAPLGDPMEFRLRGYELTLRRDDAKQIEGGLLPEAVLGEDVPREIPSVPHPASAKKAAFIPRVPVPRCRNRKS